jgi:hypothetical protein
VGAAAGGHAYDVIGVLTGVRNIVAREAEAVHDVAAERELGDHSVAHIELQRDHSRNAVR